MYVSLTLLQIFYMLLVHCLKMSFLWATTMSLPYKSKHNTHFLSFDFGHFILIQCELCRRQNASQIVVDPNLYLKKKSPILYAAETREKPDAFEIFGGLVSFHLHTKNIQNQTLIS